MATYFQRLGALGVTLLIIRPLTDKMLQAVCPLFVNSRPVEKYLFPSPLEKNDFYQSFKQWAPTPY